MSVDKRDDVKTSIAKNDFQQGYTEVLSNNAIIGFKIAMCDLASSTLFSRHISIATHPFLNKLIEFSSFNFCYNNYIKPLPSAKITFQDGFHYNITLLNNPIYKGVLHFDKVAGQAEVISSFGPQGNVLMKDYFVPLVGRVAFFTVGEVESTLPTHLVRIIFTGLQFTYYLQDNQKAQAPLNLAGASKALCAGGLAAALVINDLSESYLPEKIVAGYLSFELFAAGISTYRYYISDQIPSQTNSQAIGKIAAFTIGKAAVATGALYLGDHSEQIKDFIYETGKPIIVLACTMPVINSLCDYFSNENLANG